MTVKQLRAKVEKLRLGPGEVAVVSLEHYIDAEQAQGIRDTFAEVFDHRRVLVLAKGVSIETVTVEELERLLAESPARQ